MQRDGLTEKWLAEYVADPHLIFEVDKQQRVGLDGKQGISPHQLPEDLSSIELAEMTI